jgi:hypothetical protein
MTCVLHRRSKIGTISSPERRRAACAGWAAPRRRDVTTCRMGWRPQAAPGMAFGCVPPARGWTRRRSDACPVMAPKGAARDGVPTTAAAGCIPSDDARGRSRRRPIQALHAFPAMALGCLIRTRWRSGCANHGVESRTGRSSHGLLVLAQRAAHQPRRPDRLGSSSRHDSTKKSARSRRRNGVGLHALVGRHHAAWTR